MSECQLLKNEYQKIETLKKQFDLELEKAIKTGETQEAKKLKTQIQENLQTLKEKLVPRDIKAVFTNPETNEQKEIKLNLQEKIQETRLFCQKHNLPEPSEQEIKTIWRKNQKEIQQEMQTYGYDEIILISENLPDTQTLHQKMSEGYAETWQSDNFKNGGSFAGAKTEKQKTRICLLHSEQNIYNNEKANPYLKATLNKSILQLFNLTQVQIEEKIQAKQAIPINLEIQINNQNQKIQAEGLSLDEYLIFQRQYFEKNQKHLDESGYSWLPKTRSASHFVRALWSSGNARLDVGALDADYSNDDLCCRLSRSFELA